MTDIPEEITIEFDDGTSITVPFRQAIEEQEKLKETFLQAWDEFFVEPEPFEDPDPEFHNSNHWDINTPRR